jgi:hypothetical protein
MPNKRQDDATGMILTRTSECHAGMIGQHASASACDDAALKAGEVIFAERDVSI